MRNRPRPALDDADQVFLAHLLDTCGPRLLAYVRRTFSSVHDAEDIVAETFCRAAGNMATLRTLDRPDLYLLTTARNICRDRFRRQLPGALPQEAADRQVARDGNPHDASGERERLELLRQAVEALPEALREIVVLRLSTALRFEDIAEMLGIPLGTALSRMHTAFKQLRATLRGKYDL